MNKKILFGGIVIACILIAWPFVFKQKTKSEYDLNSFAKCLASKNVTMYGAAWCPHCQKQKKEFGGSFKFVPYVECPDNPDKCLKAGIEGYPTWVFADQSKLVGEQTFEALAEKSSCPLVKATSN